MTRSLVLVLSMAGVLGIVMLINWQGARNVGAHLATGGWQLLWLAPWYLLCMVFDSASWSALLAPARHTRWLCLYTTWVGAAVNWLLPVAQVGGDLLRIRLVHQRDVPFADAVASTIVDKTLQAVTVLVFAFAGTLALVAYVGQVPYGAGVLGSSAAVGLGVLVFYLLQRRGLFAGALRRARIARRFRSAELQQGAEQIDEAVRTRYADGRALRRALGHRVLFRLLMVGEVYLAMRFLGQPISLFDSFIIQSLSQAVRSAAFLVPGGMGVQEGGIVLLTMSLGIDADIGVSLALAKRARELLVGLPALLWLQWRGALRWWR